MGLGRALDVLCLTVRFGVDGDRRDPELVERSDDPNGDLAAVGDQDPCKHRGAMVSARLVLVRHGESTDNALARLQGQADPSLSEAGRAQAVALREALPRFEQVVTSDLERASETAALLGYPGRGARRALPPDRAGRVAPGRPLVGLRGRDRLFVARRGDHTPAGGESWLEFPQARGRGRGRVGAGRRHVWLVVCHGDGLGRAAPHVTGADPRTIAGPVNTSVTVVRTGPTPRLERYAWTPGVVSVLTSRKIGRQFTCRGPVLDTVRRPHPGAFEGRYKWEPAGRHNGAAVSAGYPTT